MGERGRDRGRGVVKEVALPQTWEICGFAPNVRNRWLCPTYFVVHSSIIKSIHRGCDCEGITGTRAYVFRQTGDRPGDARHIPT